MMVRRARLRQICGHDRKTYFWPAAMVLATSAPLFVGCAASSRFGGTAAFDVREVPASGADLADGIPVLDLLVDTHRSLHLVWVVSSPSRAAQLFYARGDDSGRTWTSPRSIADNVFGLDAVRVLQSSDGVHVLFDKTLRHMISRDNGVTWSEQQPLIAQRRLSTDFFDAATFGDQIVVAYLTQPRAADNTRRRDANWELYVVPWRDHGEAATSLVTSFPASVYPPVSPRLVADSTNLHLLCAVHAKRQSGPTVEGMLYYMRGADGGARWSEPANMLAEGAGASASGQAGVVQSIQGIEMIADRRVGGLLVVYNKTNVYATQSADGTRWSPAMQVYRGRGWANYVSRSVEAAQADSGGRVFWIDTSHRTSDRSWLNPLGGFPWSDDPDWSNNDVMMLPLEAIRVKSEMRRLTTAPERLTRDESFARVVRVRPLTDSLVVVWSGRRKVGKRLDTDGEKPRLFYAMVWQ